MWYGLDFSRDTKEIHLLSTGIVVHRRSMGRTLSPFRISRSATLTAYTKHVSLNLGILRPTSLVVGPK